MRATFQFGKYADVVSGRGRMLSAALGRPAFDEAPVPRSALRHRSGPGRPDIGMSGRFCRSAR